MPLTQVISKEKRKGRTPLENAALALDAAESVASIGQNIGSLSKSIVPPVRSSTGAVGDFPIETDYSTKFSRLRLSDKNGRMRFT